MRHIFSEKKEYFVLTIKNQVLHVLSGKNGTVLGLAGRKRAAMSEAVITNDYGARRG